MRADQLHVIGAYSNPRRYQVRPKLLRPWVEHMLDSGVTLTLVVHNFGERDCDFDPHEFPGVKMIELRGGPEHELWLQYALYNHGLYAAMNAGAKYLCFQDTDIRFTRKDWAAETLHMLQHHPVGQTWTTSADLGPDGSVIPNEWGNWVDRSFCAAWKAGDVEITDGPYAQPVTKAMIAADRKRDWRQHTGYSWAIRADALKKLGRLPDWLIVGSSDWHMALGFAGKLRQMVHDAIRDGGEQKYSPGYYRKLLQFAALCDEHIRQDIGVVPGHVLHGWHGPKRNRFYGAREQILTEAHFDPERDIIYDGQGLPSLCTDNRPLRDGLRRYNGLRNEDSIDV